MVSSNYFLENFSKVSKNIDCDMIENMVDKIKTIKEQSGRIFFIGNGGSVSTCSHAVNDFRKISEIECYSPMDNYSELSARTNDDGFDTIFVEWLRISALSNNDAIFVISVGGGDKEKNISYNIVNAIDYANQVGATVFGIVGKDGGYTAKNGDSVIIIPTGDCNLITPTVESFHSVILHLLVSHPTLKLKQTKWESIGENR